MHILGGLLLLALIFGGFFIAYHANVFDSLLSGNSNGSSLFGRATSTITNSPHYHEVRIQFVSLGDGSKQPMVVSLSSSFSGNDGVTVTGWSLRTNNGTFAIPKATNAYSPSVAGVPPEDIYLRSGGTVNIYSAKRTQGSEQAIRSGANEWQIWLNKNFLSSPHGTITLRDDKGKTVDQYKY